VLKALKIIAQNNEQFDFIFLGAPYDNPVLESALELLGAGLPLKPNGSIIAEHRKQHVVPKNIGKLSLVNQRIYGDTAFSFYQIKDA
jgi:16S rRNA G966 N2-methylase RsmD